MPRRATLEGFAKEVSARDGVCLAVLEPLTTLLVRTQNSEYRIIVIEGSSVLVQGGQFFPQATATTERQNWRLPPCRMDTAI